MGVPKVLTPLDKQSRITTSQEFFDICGNNPDDVFLFCHLIIHGFDSTIWSQNKSMQWIEMGEQPPRKFKVKISASELMATVFWDHELILFIKYL